jgi:hypothetical protein
MAAISLVKPTAKGAVVTRVASTPAGDTVPSTGGDILLHFENGHASSITVTIAPTKLTGNLPGAGPVDVPTRTLVLAAGDEGAIRFRGGDAGSYTNAQRQIPITYTGGNALLTVMALDLS